MARRDPAIRDCTLNHPEDRYKDGADQCTLPPQPQPQSTRRFAPQPLEKKCSSYDPQCPDVNGNCQQEQQRDAGTFTDMRADPQSDRWKSEHRDRTCQEHQECVSDSVFKLHDPERQKEYDENQLDRERGPEGRPEESEPELCGRHVIVHASIQRDPQNDAGCPARCPDNFSILRVSFSIQLVQI